MTAVQWSLATNASLLGHELGESEPERVAELQAELDRVREAAGSR